ncbi:MAG: hypothetical protein SNG38_03390 [Rikenellaceae bacterium]
MMNSTTISLFDNILKGVGRHPKSGKKKGGMKVHTLMKYDVNVPDYALPPIRARSGLAPVRIRPCWANQKEQPTLKCVGCPYKSYLRLSRL